MDYFPWTYIENKDKYIRQIYLNVKGTWVLSDVEKRNLSWYLPFGVVPYIEK